MGVPKKTYTSNLKAAVISDAGLREREICFGHENKKKGVKAFYTGKR